MPTGLVIGASNGIISGSPSVAGNFLITVTVSDSQGVSDSVTFTWVVDAQTGGNTLGIVNPGTPVSAVGEPVTLAIDAGNVENLTFFATAMPPGITFNATTGVFSGAPTASGAFEVVIVAQTAFDNRDVDTFTWQIFGADESGPSIDALSYWPLDNHFGDVLGTNDAQPAGSLALVTDAERGKVLACTGSATDYLQITNTLTPDFSMAFWMKTSATSFTGGAAWAGSGIVWSDISGAADDMVIAHLNNSIGFWDGDGPNKANATQSLSDNTWHHIVVTREAGVASKIFIDGTLAVTSGAGVAALTANPIMHICANTLNSKAFDGLLDDLLLFDRVLNPSEVTALANDAITIGSGGGSASTTVAVTGTTVWNVNPDNNSVSATNVTTQVATQVAVGSAPWSLAISPVANELWVVNKGSASISVINLATKVMTRTITLPKSSQPHGIVFGSDGFAYVALEATGKVQKINAQTDAVVSTLSLVGRVRHLSITADGATLYASRFVSAPVPGESGAAPNTDLAKAEIYKIATGSLALVDVLTLGHNDVAIGEVTGPGLPNYLNAPVISPDGSSLWIPSKQDNIGGGQLRGTPLSFDQAVRATTTAISLGSGQSIATIDHDNSSVATGAVFSADGQYLFVALETSREVAVVDVSAGVEILRINVGRAPQGLMLNTAQTQLYVHNFMDRSLSIVDVANLLAGTSFNVGDIDTVSLVASEALPPAVFTGKQLFYDAMDDRLAEDNYMSCASCHNEGDDDGRVWDFTQFGEGVRNTINLRGKAGTGHGPLHWTGNFDEVQDFEGQIRALAGGIGLLNGSVNSPLAAPNANLSADLDALSAYVSSLSKVDPSPARKANGDLTTKAEAGKTLFANKNCGSCHSGSNFTDSALDVFHNIGTLTPASGNRLSATLPGLDTPSLLGVWATAPYLHDGSATSLEAAIMAHDGLGIGLVPLSQLAAFLNQLDANEQ